MSERRDRGSSGDSKGFSPSGRQIVAGICIVIVLILALANLEDATVDFVFGDVTLPLFFVVVGAGLLGALIGWMIARHRQRDD